MKGMNYFMQNYGDNKGAPPHSSHLSADGLPLLAPGCSACAWETADGHMLWGRNFDYNRLAQGTRVTYMPKGSGFCTCCGQDGAPLEAARCESLYSCAGAGLLLPDTAPALYEGMNSCGLMGGQLYYREFAHFDRHPIPGRLPVQPAFLVTYLLAMCATVEEASRVIREQIWLAGLPLLGAVPPVHWMFTDAGGESIVVEAGPDGVHLYRRALGILTNSPSYPWQRLNLLNYSHLRDADYGDLVIGEEHIPQCFSGTGALGLPGDWSSPSRFVRLAFLRQHCPKGRTEAEAVSRLFRILQGVAFPLGAVRVAHPGTVTSRDGEPSPFDYTVYSCVMSAQSLRYYWMTYQNTAVRYVDIHQLEIPGQGTGNLHGCRQFPFSFVPEFVEESASHLP